MAFETEDHETQYCFPAFNSSCIKGTRFKHEYNIMYVFFSLLSAWTVFLNLLVIISISHFKKLHTPTNLIILSLAVSDMLIGLIVIPIEAVTLIETCWYFGDTVCGLFVITLGLLLGASLSNLLLIAVDRYVAVCHPLLYPQKITTTRTLISICLAWSCCSIYNMVFVNSNGYFNMSEMKRADVCVGQCSVIISPAWRFTDLTFYFLLPCSVIISMYLKIFYVAQQQVKVINSLKGIKCVAEVSVKRKSESKAALTLGIIIIVYLFCVIPYYICSLTETSKISSTAITLFTWTMYVGSGLNPLIYALFYRWFKVSVKLILTFRIFQPASSMVDIFSAYNS